MTKKPTKVTKNVFDTNFDKVICGVYCITSPTGAVYIGEGINIKNRWDSYRNLDCSKQKYLYNSLKLYGWEAHKFEIIFIVDMGDTDTDFYKHKQVLRAIEETFICYHEQRGIKMLNSEKGRNELVNILNSVIIKPKVTPIFQYEIQHKHTREIFVVNSLVKFGYDHKMKTTTRLSDTLYSYDTEGYLCDYANEYKMLSKHCITSTEDDEILQLKINNIKSERSVIRAELLQKFTKKSPNAILSRASIYKYEILNIKTDIIYEVIHLPSFCEEHKLNESGLICTLYAIDQLGNRLSKHKGHRMLSKKYIDERFDNGDILKVINDIREDRELIRKNSNKKEKGSDELSAIISENSMRYLYKIENIITGQIYETMDLYTFMEDNMPKDKSKDKASLVNTLYGCNEKGMPRNSYKGFRIIDKVYKDTTKSNDKIIEHIEISRQNRLSKRIENEKKINRKMFTVINVVTNECITLSNFQLFCDKHGLSSTTLIEQYVKRLGGKKLAPHRDHIVTDRFWSFDRNISESI